MAVNLSQVSLTNWAAGGQNSLAVNGLLNSFASYKKGKSTWENTLDLGYGVIKQGTKDFFKADDKLEFNLDTKDQRFEIRMMGPAERTFKLQLLSPPDSKGKNNTCSRKC